MKRYLPLISLLFLYSCGTDKKDETKKEEPEGSNPNTYVEDEPNMDETTCYEYESYCKGESGSKLKCDLHLTILNDSVTANAFCEGCEGSRETFYKGIQHEDTLILDEIATEPDGKEIRTQTFWIMSGDQLNQLVTTKKNGKVILKEQTTHTFLLSYLKKDCE